MTNQTVTETAIVPSSVNKIDVAHLAGLIDGGGSIRVAVAQQDSYALGYSLTPTVRFSTPRKKDPAIGKLEAFCEEHNIRYSLTEAETTIELSIDNKEGVKIFLEKVIDYLVTTFEDALIVMNEIIPRIEDKQHTNKEGFCEIMGYVDLLGGSGQTENRKYTQEYFLKLWSLL
jgi:hypothetical protein